MPDKTWKQAERRIAGLLGGRRVPVTGRARGDAPDIAHPWLSIEVKHRAHLPSWLMDAMQQAAAAANLDQLPIVVLHQAGMPYRGSVMMIRLEDFIAYFGDGEEVPNG